MYWTYTEEDLPQQKVMFRRFVWSLPNVKMVMHTSRRLLITLSEGKGSIYNFGDTLFMPG